MLANRQPEGVDRGHCRRQILSLQLLQLLHLCCGQILSVDISVDPCLLARVPERLIRLSHEFKLLLGHFLNLIAGIAVAIWQAAPLLSGFVLLYQ